MADETKGIRPEAEAAAKRLMASDMREWRQGFLELTVRERFEVLQAVVWYAEIEEATQTGAGRN